MNIAEDLKEYAKMTIAPDGGAEALMEENAAVGEKKDKLLDEISEMADKQQAAPNLVSIEDSDLEDDAIGERPQYLYMELESTVSFK